MRIKNHTDIPDQVIRGLIAAVRPPGISGFDVRISNYNGRGGRGRAYSRGSGYHDRANPFVVVSIPRTDRDARYIRKAFKGYLRVVTGNRMEALVYILAHELRHLWQAAGPLDGWRCRARRGMVYGSRGRFSERDADAYGLQMLRRFRRGELNA